MPLSLSKIGINYKEPKSTPPKETSFFFHTLDRGLMTHMDTAFCIGFAFFSLYLGLLT
jgi:hypothetical protein